MNKNKFAWLIVGVVIGGLAMGLFQGFGVIKLGFNESSATNESGCEEVPGGRARRSCLAAYYDCIGKEGRETGWYWFIDDHMCYRY